jgi:hypothetical protein
MQFFDYNVSDRFGYYLVGDQKFYSKTDAIKYMERTGVHLSYHYHDDVFAQHDWTQEPTASLDELYRQRAQHLRDKYEYLVLSYSGGADSHQMLMTFIKNNIHIDEILIYHCLSVNPDELFTNSEVTRVAVPFAQKIVSKHPNIKLRVVDMGPLTYNFFKDDKKVDMMMHTNYSQFSPSATALCYIHEVDAEYLDIINSGRKIGFVMGWDKPRVWQVDGKWCHRFLDINSGLSIMGSNIPTEMFFWNPDMPDVVVKQAHIIKRYMELATHESPFITTESTGFACKPWHNKTLWLNHHGVHSLIYPDWDITTWSMGKDPSRNMSRRDAWFRRLPNDEVYRRWEAGVTAWWAELPDYSKNRPGADSFQHGPKSSWSRAYFLER